MKTEKVIEKAVRENPDLAIVLEVSARAREVNQREPVIDSTPSTDVAATPTAAQGSIHYYSDSGHVLTDERYLVPGLK